MVEWFEKAPGSDIAASEDDPAMLLIGVGKPDWVRVPEDIGGGQYRCLEVRSGKCPALGHDHECRHYLLNGPVSCAECTQDGVFYWYRRE